MCGAPLASHQLASHPAASHALARRGCTNFCAISTGRRSTLAATPMSAVTANVLPPRSRPLRPLVVRAMKTTGADGIAIALKIGSEIICKASAGVAPAEGSKVQGDSTWSARCIREAQPISFSHSGERSGISYSAILVPLLHAGRAIGCCAAFAQRADAFTPDHVRALVAIAASAVSSVTPEPKQDPLPIPKADIGPSPALSAERLKEIETELVAFAAAEKHRSRMVTATKLTLASILVVAAFLSCFPDQVRGWAQPILQRVGQPFQSSPSRRSQQVSNLSAGAISARSDARK